MPHRTEFDASRIIAKRYADTDNGNLDRVVLNLQDQAGNVTIARIPAEAWVVEIERFVEDRFRQRAQALLNDLAQMNIDMRERLSTAENALIRRQKTLSDGIEKLYREADIVAGEYLKSTTEYLENFVTESDTIGETFLNKVRVGVGIKERDLSRFVKAETATAAAQ